MNKKGLGALWIIVIVAVVIIVLFAGYNMLSSGGESESSASDFTSNGAENEAGSNVQENVQENTEEESPAENVIEITSSGFSPSVLEINKGESITWVNMNPARSWPASDIHPTHTTYPGSSKSKCGTSEESVIFDACRGLNEGESYEFIFNEIGSWDFHDHLKPGWTGKIVVR